MFSKLKQFKDLRTKAKTVQSALAQESAEGSAGWGKVKVRMNGNQQVLGVDIDPSVMGNREEVQKLVMEATNDVIQKIQKIMSSKLKDLGGLDLAQEFGDALKK